MKPNERKPQGEPKGKEASADKAAKADVPQKKEETTNQVAGNETRKPKVDAKQQPKEQDNDKKEEEEDTTDSGEKSVG